MELLVSGHGGPLQITPERAGWTYVGFETARLQPRERRTWTLKDREACVVLITGRCVLRAGGTTLDASDGRPSPFDGPPHVLHVPPGIEFSAVALDGPVDLAIGSAPGSRAGAARGFAPKDARLEMRGSGS